jgi:hypothetical protein
MWIRSQGKERLINCNVIYHRLISGRYYIEGGVTDEGGWTLGTYKSEERALEVIDEIQERILGIGLIKVTGNTTGYYPIVYEMPKE